MSWFKRKPKTCRQCEYYSVYKTNDVIHPDKSITPGEVKMVACGLGKFELHDERPCEKFERAWESTRMLKFRGATALCLYLRKEGIFDPRQSKTEEVHK